MGVAQYTTSHVQQQQHESHTCKAKVSVASRPTVSHTTPGSSAAPSLVDGAGSSSNASADLPPNLTTILPLAGKALLMSGSTACMQVSSHKEEEPSRRRRRSTQEW